MSTMTFTGTRSSRSNASICRWVCRGLTVGFPRPLVCGLNFAFQPEILLLAPRGRALAPGVIAAFRDFQNSAHRRYRMMLSQLLNPGVSLRDSFAKYAAHFFSRSRSSFTSANSLRNRASSTSVSVGARCPCPTVANFPLREARTRLPRLLFGTDRRFAAASTDSPSNSTSFIASARNSSL